MTPCPASRGAFSVLCSCPMSDDGLQNKHPEQITLAATAEAVASLDLGVIRLEEQLAPTFRKLDMARLYRISKGENIPVPGGYSGSQKGVQLIAQYWYERRSSRRREVRALFYGIAGTVGAAALLKWLSG